MEIEMGMRAIPLAMAVLILSMPTIVACDVAKVRMLRTPAGVKFALLGSKPAKPAPTLFVFATTAEDSLKVEAYNQVGRLLSEQGFISVSIDLPCHGEDAIEGEPSGLDGWRKRLDNGQDLLGPFLAKARGVLDYMVEEGYTDPLRVAACGTSRGGFAAMHFAASEPRVRCVAGFSPVTDLMALREFQGDERNASVVALAAANCAEKLADRWLWICIGNEDKRVSTESAISFSRKVVASAETKSMPANVDLHVIKGQKHALGHLTHVDAHKEAAAWILDKCSPTAATGQ
jgi:dienelactone hydrolase